MEPSLDALSLRSDVISSIKIHSLFSYVVELSNVDLGSQGGEAAGVSQHLALRIWGLRCGV